MNFSRRDMLLTGAAGLALAGCGPGESGNLSAPVRTAPDNEPAPAATSDPLAELDGVATAELIAKGEITAREAVAAAIARAKALEPQINGIVNETYEAALARAETELSGPFAGVPFFVKDLHRTTGQPLEFGSRGFKGYVPDVTDPVIQGMFDAGLVSLGKSTTPEAGLISTTEPLSSGPTRNPWNLDHSSGGSSGGAAALTAARVVPFAQASDGGGSIRIPASCCGLFGLKPSRGRTLPRDFNGPPPVEISVVLSVSRSVRDTAWLLDAVERKGAEALLSPVGRIIEASSRRLTIGYAPEPLIEAETDPEVAAAMDSVRQLLEELGHTVKPVSLRLDGNQFKDDFLLYWAGGAAEFAMDSAKFSGKVVSDEIVEPWTQGLAQYFLARRGELPAAIGRLQAFEAQYENALSELGVDLILTPTVASAPPPIGYQGPEVDFDTLLERVVSFAAFTSPQNVSGAAAMSVPLSWSASGLPIGSHFAGRTGDEAMLLGLAYELEAARPWAGRRPPVSA